MKAGIAMGLDSEGNLISARLMGGPDQCLQVRVPLDEDGSFRFCMLAYPHEGVDHDYQGRMTEAAG